jgi:hypothetical protein
MVSSNGNGHHCRLDEVLADSHAQLWAIDQGIAQDLVRHKKLGHSVFVWRDGKVVEVPPEEIPDDGWASVAPLA